METNKIAILGGLQPLTCGLEVSCSIQVLSIFYIMLRPTPYNWSLLCHLWRQKWLHTENETVNGRQ